MTLPSAPGAAASPRSPWSWLLPTLALAALTVIYTADLNRPLFLTINRLSAYTGDTVWAYLTTLGDPLVALALLFPFVGRRPDLIFATFLGGLLATLWVHGLKQPLGVDRPPAEIARDLFTVIGPRHHHNAFPSGHTTTAMLLAGLIALHWPGRWFAWTALVLGLLAGTARMVVGVHWPLDVVGGAFGGWLAAVAGVWLARRWHWGYTLIGQRALGTLLAILPLWLLVHDTGYPTAAPLQYAVAVATLLMGTPGFLRLWRPAP